MTKQSLIRLNLTNSKSHIIIMDTDYFEKIIPISSAKPSSAGLSDYNPELSLMAQEVEARQNNIDSTQTDFYVTTYNYATFLDRIVSFEVIFENAEVSEDGKVTPKKEIHQLDNGSKSVVKLEDSSGAESYVVALNQDLDQLFTRIMATSKAPITQISSENPQLYIVADVVDYNDLGNGAVNGVFYLTGTKLALFMNNFVGMQVIRKNVAIDANGYIVGGADF